LPHLEPLLRRPGAGSIAILVAIWVLAGCGFRGAERPSIVLIVADTLRADFLGLRGTGGPDVTPALDGFAGRAVDFRRAFAAAPWTKPSVASLLTGVHPAVHGVTNHDGHFWSGGESAANRTGAVPQALTTIAEALRAAGYRTAGFVANEWLARGYGFEQGFDHYEDDIPSDLPGAAFERADRWLAEHAAGGPFFVYVHAMEPHGPYDAPVRFVDVARRAALGDSRPLTDAEYESIPEYLRDPAWSAAPAARDLLEWRVRYAAGVAAFDRGLGIFLERLERRGVLEDAAVILTADHGEELLEHGGWDHGRTLYDEQLHVPLLLLLPGAEPRQVEDVVSLVDLHPTLLELAGLAAAADADDASSLLPLVRGQGTRPTRSALAMATKWRPDLHAIRTADHKLILDMATGAGVLFDLASDPGERRSAAADQREVADDYARRLLARTLRMRGRAVAAEDAPLDASTIEALAALGYVDE